MKQRVEVNTKFCNPLMALDSFFLLYSSLLLRWVIKHFFQVLFHNLQLVKARHLGHFSLNSFCDCLFGKNSDILVRPLFHIFRFAFQPTEEKGADAENLIHFTKVCCLFILRCKLIKKSNLILKFQSFRISALFKYYHLKESSITNISRRKERTMAIQHSLLLLLWIIQRETRLLWTIQREMEEWQIAAKSWNTAQLKWKSKHWLKGW